MRIILFTLLLLTAGCPGTPGPADMHPGRDNGMHPDLHSDDLQAADLSGQDLRMADLSMPDMRIQDLNMVDLTMDLTRDLRPPTLEPRPTCPGNNVNVNTVYTQVIQGNCSCHLAGGMSGGLSMGMSAAEFKAAVVNKDATFAAMKRITPSDINNSYLLYKILNLQFNVTNGSGGQMPSGGMLNDNDKCILIDWVASGAN